MKRALIIILSVVFLLVFSFTVSSVSHVSCRIFCTAATPTGYVSTASCGDITNIVERILAGYTEGTSQCSGSNLYIYTINTEVDDCAYYCICDNTKICSPNSCERYYYDGDADGYGYLGLSQDNCVKPDGYVSNSADCIDSVSSINPDAVEICDVSYLGNPIDNNCNGQANEGCDDDSDGYCDSSMGYSAIATIYMPCSSGGNDCNDNNNFINPSKTEICGNLIDEDCNTATPDTGCSNGKQCVVDTACSSGSCNAGICGNKVSDGNSCDSSADCTSNNCDGTTNKCTSSCSPSTIICGDGIDNDCIGGDETNCLNGAKCSLDSACSFGSCYQSICRDRVTDGGDCDSNGDCWSLSTGLPSYCDTNAGNLAHPMTCRASPTTCIPSCTGKQCGSDGCGGTCGSCSTGNNCIDNKCVLATTTTCNSDEVWDAGLGICKKPDGTTCTSDTQCISQRCD